MIYTVTEESGTKKLEQLAGSASTGTPLGTWASFENDYAPNIEWIQGGTTFNPNTYPALAMYLGGNTVPERFDHNRLGDAELITVEYLDASTSTLRDVTPTSFTTIAYDGEIEVNARFIGNTGLMGAYLNDKYIAFINIYNGGAGDPEYKTIALSVKKGDRLCLVFNRRYTSSTANTWLGSPYVQARFYKHPLFIKATPTSSDSDYEGTLNAIREFYVRNNTYSTEERLTGGVWIDGKPIYRKVYERTDTSPFSDDSLFDVLDKVTYLGGQWYLDRGAGSQQIWLPLAGLGGGNFGIRPDINIQTKKIDFENNGSTSASNISVIYLIIEYTKTTD